MGRRRVQTPYTPAPPLFTPTFGRVTPLVYPTKRPVNTPGGQRQGHVSDHPATHRVTGQPHSPNGDHHPNSHSVPVGSNLDAVAS